VENCNFENKVLSSAAAATGENAFAAVTVATAACTGTATTSTITRCTSTMEFIATTNAIGTNYKSNSRVLLIDARLF